MVGGGMANTFLVAQGLDLKASLVEPDRLDLARTILARAAAQGSEVLRPTDRWGPDAAGPTWWHMAQETPSRARAPYFALAGVMPGWLQGNVVVSVQPPGGR
jgi:hypothetical protein